MFVACYRKPNPIDPEILRSATIMHDIQCVPNPGTFFRNQISYKMSEDVVQNHSLSNSDTPIGQCLFIANIVFQSGLHFLLTIVSGSTDIFLRLHTDVW